MEFAAESEYGLAWSRFQSASENQNLIWPAVLQRLLDNQEPTDEQRGIFDELTNSLSNLSSLTSRIYAGEKNLLQAV